MTAQPLILVVDDDVDFLELTRNVLEREGYRVACCAQAREALAKMAEDPPDLIVTDLMMESLDTGFSFSRQIRDDPRFAALPIILVTAAGSARGFDFRPQTTDDLAAMRVDAFLEKPIVPKKFLKKVAELLAAGR